MSIANDPPAQKRIGRPADAAKRAGIVEAASKSFFEDGFAGTSIEQVAADAGVSKVTIYNHFGDKRGLFAAAVERECERMGGYFSLEKTPPGTIAQRLAAIAQAMVEFLSRPEMIQFDRRIAAETAQDPAIGEAFLEAGPWRMKADFSAWLARAAAHGELRIADPDLAAEQFVALAKGMGDLERRFGAQPSAEDNERRLKGAVELFLASYGVD
ncbi:TetR/AcrR family transcriptional regulator [Erythrobacter sp.]|uniref:TetR/AcrR family transcriptional regulator n=1 Tax=Erythrobacter sp. TaxID=1042 RepID=UPI002E9D30E2|nr:TetR/AcrR family transcriptional regulator [Erythrobacter sp.]